MNLENIRKDQKENPLSPSGKKREEPNLEGVLSEEEAQDLANMMRAVIDVKTDDTGKIAWKEYDKSRKFHEGMDRFEWAKMNTEVTKGDYELALQKVEEIEKLANEETNKEELNFKLKKILQLSGHTVATVLIYAFGFGDALSSASRGQGMRNAFESMKESRAKLADAKTILKRLIKEGDKFGKEEKEYNREKTI